MRLTISPNFSRAATDGPAEIRRLNQLRDWLEGRPSDPDEVHRLILAGGEVAGTARRVEFRPRYFKRGQLTRLILDYLRDHTGELVAVADIMPAAVGDRTLNSTEHRRVKIVTYELLHKLAKRGTVQQTGQGAKGARWRLADDR